MQPLLPAEVRVTFQDILPKPAIASAWLYSHIWKGKDAARNRLCLQMLQDPHLQNVKSPLAPFKLQFSWLQKSAHVEGLLKFEIALRSY